MHLAHAKYPGSGRQEILVKIGDRHYIVDVQTVWQKDLDILLQEKREKYDASYGAHTPTKYYEKVKKQLSVKDLSRWLKKKVNVLLYDLTVSHANRDMNCEQGCDVMLDDETIEDARLIHVVETTDGQNITVYIDQRKHTAERVVVKNNSLVVFTNYERNFSGLPMNVFRGDIIIEKQKYKHLDYGWLDRYTIVNSLPLNEYLKGVGEIKRTSTYGKTQDYVFADQMIHAVLHRMIE